MNEFLKLTEGTLFMYENETWRIIHVEDCERVLATRTSDGRHDFFPVSDLKPLTTKQCEAPPLSLPKETDDSETVKQQTKIRRIRSTPNDTNKQSDSLRTQLTDIPEEFDLAHKILSTPRFERRHLIQEMCEKFNYSEKTAYRRIEIVRTYNNSDALLHSVRSDKGVRRIKDAIKKIIRNALSKHRFVQTPKTLPSILELINGVLRSENRKEISLSTLRSFEQETSYKDKLKQQGRNKQAKDLFRPKVGHLPNNDYPLAIVQVDHTPIQVCLVDSKDREPIGDAWLTLVIDTYSRMVLGFFLTFDAPSTLSTGMALAHAFLPKTEYLKKIGVKGQWPCWGFPDVILVDNAVELNGHMMHGARKKYRFTLRDRPVGAANFGGHVESAFRTFMNEFKSLEGTKFSNPTERAQYDSEGNAIFTLDEFEAFFVDFLVNEYHIDKHTGEGMNGDVPLTKWNKGIFDGDTFPPRGLPPIPTDELSIRISLMPLAYRTIRNGIIEIHSHKYHEGSITLLGDSINLERPLEERKFEIRYDPRNISVIWIFDEIHQNYIPIRFADLALGPISLWEDKQRRKRLPDHAKIFEEDRYQSRLRREDMRKTSAKRTKQQRLEAEKEQRRNNQAIAQPSAPPINAEAPAESTSRQSRRDAMRSQVRAATMQPKPKVENRSD